MKARITLLALVLSTASTSTALAEQQPVPDGDDNTVSHLWGFETELIWPIIPGVEIYSFRFSRYLYGELDGLRGDLLFGGYLRPNVGMDVVERIDEYVATVGYRQYFVHGLHAEVVLHTGWARGKNNRMNGRDYEDIAVLVESNVGYAFSMWRHETVGLFVAPQFGFIAGLYTDIGPREESDFAITGRLAVGLTW